MGNILTPNFNGKLKSARGQHNFCLEKIGENYDVSFNGDIHIIIDMIYRAMEHDANIAKTVITTALIFADKKKIAITDLKKHSFIQDNKPGQIIT